MKLKSLSQNLKVHMGAVNVGIVQSERDALLIDFGACEVLEEIKSIGIERFEKILVRPPPPRPGLRYRSFGKS
ncbi:MAG: hypothetical protein ACUVTL_08155 [Thermoproteota archaeon]